WSMAAPNVSEERAARPMGWNRSVRFSVPSRRPIAELVLTSPIAFQSANSSSVLRRTSGCLAYSCGSPARRRTAEAETPCSSNFENVLPEKRRCLFIVLLGFERCHINGEPVLHIRLEQSLVGFIDLLDWDNFHIGSDVVFSAKIEHLLGFADASNVRAGEVAIAHNQGERKHTERLRRRADDREITVAGEQVEIGIDVVIG